MLGPFVCARFRFVAEAVTPLHLGAFAEATLRGGFGRQLKQTVCLWEPGDCPRCLLRHRCVYPYVFETAPPPGADRLRGQDSVPRPYVFEMPQQQAREVRPGGRFEFDLVLVGRAIDDFPYFLVALAQLGASGLGREGGAYRIVEVVSDGPGGPAVIFRAPGELAHGAERRVRAVELLADPRAAAAGRDVTLSLLSPLRIVYDGRLVEEPTFQDIIRALLRRVSSLCYFHCGGPLEADFAGLKERAGAVRTREARLSVREQGRYSTRQGRGIDQAGVVGRMTFEGPASEGLGAFLPLLLAGEWVHVGKSAVMGLGRYVVEAG